MVSDLVSKIKAKKGKFNLGGSMKPANAVSGSEFVIDEAASSHKKKKKDKKSKKDKKKSKKSKKKQDSDSE
jgi:hypothetical protein